MVTQWRRAEGKGGIGRDSNNLYPLFYFMEATRRTKSAKSTSHEIRGIMDLNDIDEEIARRAVVIGGKGGLRIIGDQEAAVKAFMRSEKKKKKC